LALPGPRPPLPIESLVLALSPDAERLLAHGAFLLFVGVMLALDLGVFHRKAHEVRFREAARWTAIVVAIGMLFNVLVYFLYRNHWFDLGLDVPVLGSSHETRTVGGAEAARTFFAAYVLEQSLSMDNVFVIAVIFSSLGIPAKLQHRVLFWGILGAIIMRGAMIAVGTALIERIDWIVYVFGGILILTALRMAFVHTETADPSASRVVRLLGKFLPISHELDGQKFFTRAATGALVATPIFVALVMIEVTDLIFAVDSIPAVFSLTADPFIVFTSNVLAVLGLRSLYFCLSSIIRKLKYLKPSLVVVLMFAGVKMCLVHTPFKIPTDISVGVIIGVLAVGAAASLIAMRGEKKEAPDAAV
jgi:tellurite resistance protein TerC